MSKKSVFAAVALCLTELVVPARAAENIAMIMPARPAPLPQPVDPAIASIYQLMDDRDQAMQKAESLHVRPEEIRKDILLDREMKKQIRNLNRDAQVEKDVAVMLNAIIDNLFLKNVVTVHFYCKGVQARGADFQTFFPDPVCEAFDDWKKRRQAEKTKRPRQTVPMPQVRRPGPAVPARTKPYRVFPFV